MSSKATESGKDGNSSEATEKSPGKTPSSSIASPRSKLSAIAKFLKSPRKQVKISEQNEQTKSKTSKSDKKGKMKNIKSPIKSRPIVSSKTTTRQVSKKHASSEGSEQTLHEQKQNPLGKKRGKCFSSDIVQEEESIPCGSGWSGDQNVLSVPDDGKGDGKESTVQTSLSTTREFFEVLSSPEHLPVQKKKGRKTRSNKKKDDTTDDSKDNGKKSMVQTSLSTKEFVEVLSSPEHPPFQKKKERKSRSKEKEKADKKQTRITSIFPLRKSTRKTKAEQEKDEQTRVTNMILAKQFEGIEVRTTEGKGRGVFACRDFERNEFVCEYSGELITYDEAKKRETLYNEDKNIGCYMYYLQFNNKKYCIDATAEDGTFGRLINHSRKGNCKTKIHGIDNLPHLIFVTTRCVKVGEEFLYDYGERSKVIIQSYPWLES